MKNPFKNLGPGVLVAAAFIGPGTVTVCTVAGASFGYALLWAMTLSIIATAVLQEMAARLGLVTGKGLAAVVREQIQNPVARVLGVFLMLAAIVVGNAAYEAGNISGGVLGIQALGFSGVYQLGGISVNLWSLLLGGIAFILLYLGNYKVLERVLVGLVILMSLSFVVAAILTRPDVLAFLKNSLVPSFPEGSLFTVIALIGTTVVPYNLFLHASLVSEKWQGTEDLAFAKADTYLAVVLGGLVSMAVMVAASSITATEITNAVDLAKGLEPLYGSYAKYFIALGLFAAGITSAITAPLAAAYVAQGCLGWKNGLKSKRFRAVWMVILFLGVGFSTTGRKPLEIIQFAQVANGLLLPIIAGFLFWVVNRKGVLGKFRNTRFQNILGALILLTTIILGARTILKVTGVL